MCLCASFGKNNTSVVRAWRIILQLMSDFNSVFDLFNYLVESIA
jgi:hypothetical protein